jgi:hypothetical protein
VYVIFTKTAPALNTVGCFFVNTLQKEHCHAIIYQKQPVWLALFTDFYFFVEF